MMRMIVAIGSGEATTMKLNNVYMCKGSQFNSVSHDFCHVKKSPLRKFKKAYSTYLFFEFCIYYDYSSGDNEGNNNKYLKWRNLLK